VLLRARQRGIALARFGQAFVDLLQRLLRIPQARRERVVQLPAQRTGHAAIAFAQFFDFGILFGADAIEQVAHALETVEQVALARGAQRAAIVRLPGRGEFVGPLAPAFLEPADVERTLARLHRGQALRERLAAILEHVVQRAEAVLPAVEVVR